MHRTVLPVRRRVLGEEHPDTLDSMNGLASALNAAGQHAEAIEIDRTVLPVTRRVLGEEHPHTLSAMNNLALVLRKAGQHAEAAEIKAELRAAKRQRTA